MKSYSLAILLAITFSPSLSAQKLSPSDQAAADAAIKVIRPEAIRRAHALPSSGVNALPER